jgi:DNA-binding NarL/FixJ family response regulator
VGRSIEQAGRPAIRILLVEDHEVFRHGLVADLSASGDFEIVGETPDGGEAIEIARERLPDVALMDLSLRGVSGVDAIRQIHDESPSVRILVLSVSEDEPDVLEAVKAGALGYVTKSEPASFVIDAVRRAASGETVFSPSLASVVIAEFRRLAGIDPAEPVLTARENEILGLVAKGYRYSEIARRLFIAEKTAQNHVQNILSKLQMHTRYELMRYAIRRGLDRTPD